MTGINVSAPRLPSAASPLSSSTSHGLINVSILQFALMTRNRSLFYVVAPLSTCSACCIRSLPCHTTGFGVPFSKLLLQ